MNSGPKQFNKGDAFTKQLRRFILNSERRAKNYDKLDALACDAGGTSDYYDRAKECWAQHSAFTTALCAYLEFKGWEPRT